MIRRGWQKARCVFKFIELSTLKLLSDDSNKTNKRPPSEGWRLRRRNEHFQSALRAGVMAQGVSVPDKVRPPIGGARMVGGARVVGGACMVGGARVVAGLAW